MNTNDKARLLRRIYLEWLVGALMIAGLITLVRAFF